MAKSSDLLAGIWVYIDKLSRYLPINLQRVFPMRMIIVTTKLKFIYK